MNSTVAYCDVPNVTTNSSCMGDKSGDVVEYNKTYVSFVSDFANAGILAFVMPFILVGNLTVILAVIKFQKLRTSMNTLIASLAFSDMLVGFPTVPLYVGFYIRDDVLRAYKYMCMFRFASVVTSMSGSIISLTCVSLDRYIAVIHPLHYPTIMTRQRVRRILFGIWTYAFAASILPSIGVNVWQEGMPCEFFTALPKLYTIFVVPVVLATCLLLSVSMYIAVFRVAKQHRQRMKKRNMNRAFKSDIAGRNIEREARTAKMMAFVLLLFLVFWFPFLVTSLLKYLPFARDALETAKRFGVTFAMTNSVINPIIYCWLKKDFRIAFQKLLCCITVKRNRGKPTMQSISASNRRSFSASSVSCTSQSSVI